MSSSFSSRIPLCGLFLIGMILLSLTIESQARYLPTRADPSRREQIRELLKAMMPEHERRLTLFLTVTFAFVGFLIKGFMYYQTLQEAGRTTSMPTVVVAILSDRAHLERRKAIRETWLADKGSVKAFFILASKSCGVHPQDRLDDLSCEFFHPNVTAGSFQLAERVARADNELQRPERVAVGYSFRMRYPGVLTKLGALQDLAGVKAHLIDAVTKKVMTEVLVDDGEEVGGYRYATVAEPIKLARGFEGILMITGNITATCAVSAVRQLDPVDVNRVYYDHVDENSVPYKNDVPVLLGVSAELAFETDPDLGTLKVLQRRRLWLEHIDQLDERLDKEMQKHKDIVNVDLVETYQNLPRKLSETLVHFSKQSLTFLVKVDDDVVLDLPRLKHILTTSLRTSRVIWAKTRRAFPISIYGKWAENVNFPSQVYPDFPCGATYVLSRDLVQFVARNKAALHHFQGEDVSIGTWLLGLAPQYRGENLFSCDARDCRNNVLNRAEVESPEKMRSIWDVYMQNKTLCDPS